MISQRSLERIVLFRKLLKWEFDLNGRSVTKRRIEWAEQNEENAWLLIDAEEVNVLHHVSRMYWRFESLNFIGWTGTLLSDKLGTFPSTSIMRSPSPRSSLKLFRMRHSVGFGHGNHSTVRSATSWSIRAFSMLAASLPQSRSGPLRRILLVSRIHVWTVDPL